MNTHPVIFYDGVCALCNKAVRFILRNDKKQVYRYAALQSDSAINLLGQSSDMKSFILYTDNKIYRQSAAVIHALSGLGGLWKCVLVLLLFPPFIRNGVYNLIATNRYRWFGKYDTCPLPSPDKRHLFIES